MAAGITDLITQATNGTRPSPTTLTAIRSIGASSISCGALTGWPTATAVHFIIYTTDTSGNKVSGSQLDCKGIVSGTNITNIVYKAGNDTGNAIGAIVEAAPTAAWANDMAAALMAHANQDGSLITAAVRAALNLDAGTSTGWTVLGFAVSSVLALGQRSYQMVFNGNDLTATVSPGMRVRMTRTVAAPNQCTSLNGTTQYYSKASPAAMTFTDDFTVSAWVKLSSYQAGTIVSRYNGTSGWILEVSATGQVYLTGFNAGAGNFSRVNSSQSLPLNKWVHVTAQLDMSAFTATTTTSYIMLDGIDVPALVTRGGTNPTALVQAGNLEIGTQNTTVFWNGKIAQVAVYNNKVTQATVLASIDRTLAGTETSLISAYSFSNLITDLNTTNANNLTANGAAVATNADSPFGGQADGSISTTIDYGIITKATFATNTTLIIQVPEGCTIPTTGGVSAISYSPHKVPFGFPSQRSKWQVLTTIAVNMAAVSAATLGTWTSCLVGLVEPVGSWLLGYQGGFQSNTSGSGNRSLFVTLASSAPTNLVYNQPLTSRHYTSVPSTVVIPNMAKNVPDEVSVATSYTIYVTSDSPVVTETVAVRGDQSNLLITADLAYL